LLAGGPRQPAAAGPAAAASDSPPAAKPPAAEQPERERERESERGKFTREREKERPLMASPEGTHRAGGAAAGREESAGLGRSPGVAARRRRPRWVGPRAWVRPPRGREFRVGER